MQNLLRTLTESQVAGNFEPELKLLLTSVKEARVSYTRPHSPPHPCSQFRQRQCHDTKISDAFYDSLDGLLQDLRTVTPVRVNNLATLAATDLQAG